MFINSVPVVSGQVNVPSFGAISGRIETIQTDLEPGSVTLNDSFKVTAKQVNNFAGRTYVTLEGGAGTLGTTVPGKNFKSATVAQVLKYAIGESSETQSPIISPSILFKRLTSYTLFEGSLKAVLGGLANEIGADWRTLYDGTIWLGEGESFDNTNEPPQLLDWSPPDAHAVYVDELTITPAQDLGFGEIRRIVFETGHTSRALVWA